MSRRRATVLPVALVVVMVFGVIGVLGVVSAAPNNADNRNDSEGRSNFTGLVKNIEGRVADVGPQGPSHGDMRVVNAPIYNESGKERIGRLDLFCVTTDPADESSEKAHMAECTVTYTLLGGEISAQGVHAFPKLSELPPRGVNAITGGTGKYVGVEGEVRFETRGNKVINTFHFID